MGQPTGCLNRAFTSSLQGLTGNSRISIHLQDSISSRTPSFSMRMNLGGTCGRGAVLANHYHFVAASPTEARRLRNFLGKLHMKTAAQLNLWDDKPGRKVWFQFWDSHITYECSYLARLNYVHQNPVRHGVVLLAENYKWCSAAWFARSAPPAFVKTIRGFKIDQLNVPDSF